jgi:metacaspase-1
MPAPGYPAPIMWRPICLSLTLALPTAPPVAAEVRAVLVGVGDFRVLDADLKGPPNDVRLMAEVLVARGVAAVDITVLSTDPTGLPAGVAAGPADRASILSALDSVTGASSDGDTVVFYFSGHGAQAPDMSGDEGGGHDEILLPADASGWKGAIGAVENAILDDELQVWAQGAIDGGLQVVGLIDACHSATGFRAIGGEGVARVIDEATLGIPQDVVSVAGDPQPPLSGDFVFLYSSQSDQRSFEYPLADGATWHGEFTLRLAQTLRDAPTATWAQILAATREAMVQGPARQMPDGEGPLLDATVFGEGSGSTRWPVAGGIVDGGLLHGLAKGAELAIYTDPAGGEPLAVLTVAEVTARTATLDGVLPERAAWAELVNAPPPAPLTLAKPVRADPADGMDYSSWIAALPAAGDPADLVPILTGGVVALALADGVLDPQGPGSSPRIHAEPGESPAQAMSRVLGQASHGLRLRAALAGATGRSLTGTAPVSMTIERRAAQSRCKRGSARVSACDQLWLTLTNTGGKSQDLSVLYFTVDFEVQPIWPTRNLVNRLAPGETVQVGLQIEADGAPGLEEIWVLAVPVDPAAPRVDLTRLATPQTTRDIDPGANAMALWLESRLNDDLTDDEAAMRGFSLKPAPLAMLRQPVLLNPGPN